MRKRNIYSTFIAKIKTWTAGENPCSQAEILRLLQFCVEQGIRSFKHIKNVGNHNNDLNFGTALSESGLDRRNLQIISEYFVSAEEEFSKAKILEYVDETLLNLKTDYLDLLLLKHNEFFSEEIYEALEQLIQQGKVREYGVVSTKPDAFFEKENQPQVVEMDFSIYNYDNWKNHVLKLKDTTVDIFMEDFTAEFFKNENEQMMEIDKNLSHLLLKYNANKFQVLLAWILHEYMELHLVIDVSDEVLITKTTDVPGILLDDGDFYSLKKLITNL